MGGGESKTIVNQNFTEKGVGIVTLGDSAIAKVDKTATQKVLDAAAKTVESGSDIISAPAVWLKDMQKNWLLYMAIAATILLTIAFLYCAVRSYFARKGKSSSVGQLVELASMFTNKNMALQTGFPLSTSKLSSAGPSAIVELGKI